MNLTTPQKLMASGLLDEALAALPPAETTPDPRTEIIRARIHADSRNLEEAVRTLKAARELFPQQMPVLLFTGVYQWDLGQVAEAADCFSKVLETQRENDLARSYLALCSFAEGRFEEASNMWRAHGFSDNTMFRVRVAEYIESEWLHSQRFLSERPAVFESPIGGKPSARIALAKFYRRDFEGILNHVSPPPAEDELTAFLAATAHEMLGQYTHAFQYLQPLESRRMEWPDPLVALNARLLTRAGHLQQAATEFSKVLVVGPEDYGVNYYLAVICLAYGKKYEARQYFLRAFTSYMVDTQEFQWWQLTQVLLGSNTRQSSRRDLDV